MFRLMVTIACLFIIGDYTLKLWRWCLERRQLRWWRRRVEHLSPSAPAPPLLARPLPFSVWTFLALLIAIGGLRAADHGNVVALLIDSTAWVIFLGSLLGGLSESRRKKES